ncbi:DegV family protein [Clostridium ganghwense]|uniref:DegV family protein n=1 Tax=Clostridium ganghwense TaxID=312089 RepID=A0ABT4CKF7_9CLOT|nr:DegV family protein [Clostridium ganghwense]MCY6369527.1 DegV family protein [Clostridium ganghwense]
MEKIKIITDSTADLNREMVEKYGLDVMPLIVSFGEESYLDGVDIDIHEFLRRIKDSDILPATAQITPYRFYECYKKYIDEGYKIVSIHISSKMSGTYNSACIAKDMIGTDDIVVIDSLNVTAGLGLLAMKAAELKEKGYNIYEIEEKIKETIPHVKNAYAFSSLDNLVKGGRLSKAAGVIGSFLGIKLILAVVDGEMAVIDKVRGTKKAIKTILRALETSGLNEEETSILLHIDNQDILPVLRDELNKRECNYIECEVGCVVGTHSGPDACGIAYIEKCN